MKINKADSVFSLYIRERDNWQCQRCGRQYDRNGSTQGLHCSHYIGRRNQSVRFDPENCVALCYGCHKYFDEHDRPAYTEFKINQLGEEKHKRLRQRGAWAGKRDYKLAYIVAKDLYYKICKQKKIEPKKI